MESPRIIRLAAVQDLTGLPASTVYRLMRAGTFPQCIRLAPRAVGWKYAEILQWISSRQAA
jgi:prophage regulatory protein